METSSVENAWLLKVKANLAFGVLSKLLESMKKA